jgi:8-oxo-dGTP diphosphatase
VNPDIPEGYDPAQYDRPSVTADVVVFSPADDGLQVLLVWRLNPPFANTWAIPGGFVEMNESLEEAASRELAEETGISNVSIEQLYTFKTPDRDPRTRVITVAYFTLVPVDAVMHRPGDDALSTGWFSVDNLPRLAFDHPKIVSCALTRLRRKLEQLSGEYRLLTGEFTLPELLQVYEKILGKQLKAASFSQKIISAEILEDTGKIQKRVEGRSVKIYRYRKTTAN